MISVIKSKTSIDKNATSRPAVKVVYLFVINVVELSFKKFTLVILCMAQMSVGVQLMRSKIITMSSNERFYVKLHVKEKMKANINKLFNKMCVLTIPKYLYYRLRVTVFGS